MVPLQVPLVPVVPPGIAHVDTYHLGLPLPSYAYQAAKTRLVRSVKWMPQPDSPAFHHKPLSAPGVLAAVVELSGQGQVSPDMPGGIEATHRLCAGSVASVPLPVPTQTQDPAAWDPGTLPRSLSDWLCEFTTVPMVPRF